MKKITGYTNLWSVAPGDTLEVKVSTYGVQTYRADLVRVICGDDEPGHGIFAEEEIDAPFAGDYPGRTQIMPAGSYIAVSNGAEFSGLTSFTVQAWVFPTTPDKGEQGLVAHWDDDAHSGFALVIGDHGAAELRLGDGSGQVTAIATDRPLAPRRWHLVAGGYDAATGTAFLVQRFKGSPFEQDRSADASGPASFRAAGAADAALLMAALPQARDAAGQPTRCHFNGKLDRPRLTGRVLVPSEIEALGWDAAPHERERDLVAGWDFSRDIGRARITDSGFNGLHGQAVNLPSRGVKGFNWSGHEQNFRHAPLEYGAIHFHDDDHYDAGWETDFTFVIPDDLKSGVYAARLRADDDEWNVPFFVRPPRGTATHKLAFLASTVTYLAYSNYRWQVHERYAEAAECF